jgi:hypothetical protein
MTDGEQTTVGKDEFNTPLVRALDDLVSAARHDEAGFNALVRT